MTRMLKASTIIFNKLIGKSQQECSWINCFSYSERHKRSVALTTRWIILHLSQKRHKYLSQHPKLFSSLHLILCLHAHLPKSLTKKLTTNPKRWGPSWLWGVGGGGAVITSHVVPPATTMFLCHMCFLLVPRHLLFPVFGTPFSRLFHACLIIQPPPCSWHSI